MFNFPSEDIVQGFFPNIEKEKYIQTYEHDQDSAVVVTFDTIS